MKTCRTCGKNYFSQKHTCPPAYSAMVEVEIGDWREAKRVYASSPDEAAREAVREIDQELEGFPIASKSWTVAVMVITPAGKESIHRVRGVILPEYEMALT